MKVVDENKQGYLCIYSAHELNEAVGGTLHGNVVEGLRHVSWRMHLKKASMRQSKWRHAAFQAMTQGYEAPRLQTTWQLGFQATTQTTTWQGYAISYGA